MQRYFTLSFWTSTVLILILLTSCKNSTGPEQTTLEITSESTFSVDENQTTVTTITADADSDNLGFTITGGVDQDHFSIDESGGTLRFVEAPDFENPADADADNTYQLKIEASANGNSASHEVSVSITDVDEEQVPTITSDDSFSVDENTTAVDTITASNPNGDTITYSISGGTDQEQFSINADNGALAFRQAPDFENPTDADADNIYQIDITASNGQDSVSQSLTVTVTDVTENQAPTITSGTSFSVDENTTAVATVIASDPDGNSITYSISGGLDANEFSIGASSGDVTFNSAPDYENPFDANSDNIYEIEVQASAGDKSETQSLTITVSNVNEKPTITSSDTFSLKENTTDAGTVTASDPEGDLISFSITGGVDQNLFSIDNSSGALTFNSAPDFEAPADANADNIYEVEIKASDGSKTATQNITVSVTDVTENQAPVITSGDSFSVDENTKEVATVTASDPEGDSITYSISGGLDATEFSIGASSGDLAFNSAPDYETPTDSNANNVYWVQIQASDGDRITTQEIKVTVNNVSEGGDLGFRM